MKLWEGFEINPEKSILLGPFFLNVLFGVEGLQEKREIYILKRDIDRSIRKKHFSIF